MPSLKDVQDKIVGVKKTSQITSAMNLVASAKLRGAQEKMENFVPYANKFNETMSTLSSGGNTDRFPLMEVREVKNVELVVVTSDRGLCGSFNSNIIKLAVKKVREYEAEGKSVTIVCVGKKANQILKKKYSIRTQYIDIMSDFQMFNAREIAQDVATNFTNGATDKVEVLFGHFKSVAVQRPTAQDLLPITPIKSDDGTEAETQVVGDYIYEPSTDEIMDVMQPLYLNVLIYNAMLQVGASEHAARMTAMDNATTACKDIVTDLTLVFNKARQAAVTGELMDIVGGAEALKG
jgi:F-type H+-transporting ATPase subunit gamma